MSAQKNTLFNYFGKSPSAKPSPNASPAPGTPKTSKGTSSSVTPKRALATARGGALDSPKSTKSVVREHLVAASPRTRVQRKLLDAAPPSSNVYEPHFLRNTRSPQLKKSGPYFSPQKNKENSRGEMLSPVFKALKEHEESASRINPLTPIADCKAFQSSSGLNEDVTVSPAKCSIRRTVRNLNKEFVKSPSKQVHEDQPHGRKIKDSSEEPANTSVDVYAAFGQYVAAEMRRLPNDKAVRSLKHKILKAILDVQSEQESQT